MAYSPIVSFGVTSTSMVPAGIGLPATICGDTSAAADLRAGWHRPRGWVARARAKVARELAQRCRLRQGNTIVAFASW